MDLSDGVVVMDYGTKKKIGDGSPDEVAHQQEFSRRPIMGVST